MTPDGPPMIGLGRHDNLYFNTGHGHVGWTMAVGSARILADLVDERRPDIDPSPYSPDFVAPASERTRRVTKCTDPTTIRACLRKRRRTDLADRNPRLRSARSTRQMLYSPRSA